MHVREILRAKGRAVVTVPRETSVAAAAARMQMEHVGALVVSADGRPIEGMLDERDIVRAYVRYGAGLADKTVGDVMREETATCSPADSLRHVMSEMTRHRLRHLPVIEGGALAGIVSIGDVVKYRLEELELEREIIRDAYAARS
jgi:CBS domain-containing protein